MLGTSPDPLAAFETFANRAEYISGSFEWLDATRGNRLLAGWGLAEKALSDLRAFGRDGSAGVYALWRPGDDAVAYFGSEGDVFGIVAPTFDDFVELLAVGFESPGIARLTGTGEKDEPPKALRKWAAREGLEANGDLAALHAACARPQAAFDRWIDQATGKRGFNKRAASFHQAPVAPARSGRPTASGGATLATFDPRVEALVAMGVGGLERLTDERVERYFELAGVKKAARGALVPFAAAGESSLIAFWTKETRELSQAPVVGLPPSTTDWTVLGDDFEHFVNALGVGYTDISHFGSARFAKVDANVKKYRAWLKKEGRPVWTDPSQVEGDDTLRERFWAWSAKAL